MILGMKITKASNGIFIDQSHYIEKILKKYKYFDYKPVNTSLDPFFFFDTILLLILVYIYFLLNMKMIFIIKRSMLVLLVVLDMLLIVLGLILPMLWEF